MRLHVNSITDESSAEKLRLVTSRVETIIASVLVQFPAKTPIDTLHLLTVCVDDDFKENEKWVAKNHKVHRAKSPSGVLEKVVSIAIPLRPREVASSDVSRTTQLYFESLYRQLHKTGLKLPDGFSLAPLIEYVRGHIPESPAL